MEEGDYIGMCIRIIRGGMNVRGWKYYNHAAVPTCAPHEIPDLTPLEDGMIWKLGGHPLLVRWTTDFDCGQETNWWYCIRDGKFSMRELSSSTRKHIRQSLKHNTVVRTNIEDAICDEMYRVYCEATSHYKLADNIKEEREFKKSLISRKQDINLFLAFDEHHKLLAYMTVRPENEWAEIEVAKFSDKGLKVRSSDALYYTVLDYYLNEKKLKYVSAGSRSINHQSGTQEYKERVFGFRKAYCNLHIKYRTIIRFVIVVFYPVRKILEKKECCTIIHQLNSVLKMEELSRDTK